MATTPVITAMKHQMNFSNEFHFPSESPSVYYTAPLSPLSIVPLSPLDTHDEVALPLAMSPLSSVSLSPLDTTTDTYEEVALLSAEEIGPNITLTPAQQFCTPCGKDLPLNAFCASAIKRGLKRCRRCANAQVYASLKRGNARNPRRPFVYAVKRRVRHAYGDDTPEWISTTGVVQAVMEAAKWRSKYSGSVQNLTLMQKERTLGKWMPHESVCLTVDEARIAREIKLHRKTTRNKPL
jgi:hypothetical protein